MAKINVLPSYIFNRIAAGEVVERPASVVKELIDNSIDAKATHITVKVVSGGKSLISVADDGVGIEKDELKTALMPHATSKIFCIEDLDEINTLGFRGEALPSIASVSKLQITSKTKKQENGACLVCDGGEITDFYDCGSVVGTEVVVNNLFYNTPAREKFLKKDKYEENEVTNVVSRMILGNPTIAFTYYADNELLLQSYGDGLESAMCCVYDVDVINKCHYVNYDSNGIHIEGYIGKVDFNKTTKNYQTVFLNKRYITNNTIISAMNNVYAVYLMKRRYPFYVLNLTMPSEFVDCNVNPNKTDVRFVENSAVYGALYSRMSKILYETRSLYNIESNIDETAMGYPKKPFDASKPTLKLYFNDKSYDSIKADKPEILVFRGQTEEEFREQEELRKAIDDDEERLEAIRKERYLEKLEEEKELEEERRKKSEQNFNSLSEADKAFLENKAFLDSLQKNNNSVSFQDITAKKDETVQNNDNQLFAKILENNAKNTSNSNNNNNDSLSCCGEGQTRFEIGRNINYIGQILNTYLIFDDGENMYMVDQHAAHERVLFDKFEKVYSTNEIDKQDLLLPYIFSVSGTECNFILDSMEDLTSIGIEITEFGRNTFKVSAIPLCLADINLKKFFDDLLEDLVNLKSVSMKGLLREKIAQKACKAAIKAGNKMTESELKDLMELLKGDFALKCPHGRPIAVKITQTEIEKWFKRIV